MSQLIKRVGVGTLNPVKIQAVRSAFEKWRPDIDWVVNGLLVESGVRKQPMSDEEGLDGASHRAYRVGITTVPDFAVGLEGFLSEFDGRWFNSGWVVIRDGCYSVGMASMLRMAVPETVMDMVRNGVELGVAIDHIYGLTNSKQITGHLGAMSKGLITRQDAFEVAVIAALADISSYSHLAPK